GKAMVGSPSMPSTAPLPPLGRKCRLNGELSSSMPVAVRAQNEPEPACTFCGMALASAPKMAVLRLKVVLERDFTGLGKVVLNTVPSGAWMEMGRNSPSLLGRFG